MLTGNLVNLSTCKLVNLTRDRNIQAEKPGQPLCIAGIWRADQATHVCAPAYSRAKARRWNIVFMDIKGIETNGAIFAYHLSASYFRITFFTGSGIDEVRQ